jgi:hypothetical protein
MMRLTGFRYTYVVKLNTTALLLGVLIYRFWIRHV